MLKSEEVQAHIEEVIKQYRNDIPSSFPTAEFEEWVEHLNKDALVKGYDCWSTHKDLPIEERRRIF